MAKTKSSTKKKPSRAAPKSIEEVVSAPKEPKSNHVLNSHLILCDGILSVNSLATLYSEKQKERKGGSPTHAEQDLLRAMVVMSGAAIDATLKRLIRDTLSVLTKRNPKALQEAQKHVQRRIFSDLDKRGGDRLSQILLSDTPREVLIGFIVDDITGDSLQSKDEVQKVIHFLALNDVSLEGVQEAFKTRNQIIHEMDAVIQTGQGKKRRRQRKQDEMRSHAKNLLNAAATILEQVDDTLSAGEGE